MVIPQSIGQMTGKNGTVRECLDIARGVLSGERKDVSEGATHYFNPQYARPDWASKLEKIGKIEIGKTEDGRPVYSKHEFYREK